MISCYLALTVRSKEALFCHSMKEAYIFEYSTSVCWEMAETLK